MKIGLVFLIYSPLLIISLFVLSYISFRSWFAEIPLELDKKSRSHPTLSITQTPSTVFVEPRNRTFRILLLDTVDDLKFLRYVGQNASGCPVSNCIISNPPYKVRSSYFDAIIFHANRDVDVAKLLIGPRYAKQFFIFASFESPIYDLQKLHSKQNFYNLTMTYRLDSDVVWTPRQIIEIGTMASIAPSLHAKWKKPPERWQQPAVRKMFLTKVRTAVWYPEHCQTLSQREYIVQELREYIDVDIYGVCGTKRCYEERGDCQFGTLLRTIYKFFLAFEDALCKDFITEAVYEALENSVIPVVFGGANYTRLLPPHSYINVEDFEHVRDLATHLRMVGTYEDEYSRYFWWKDYYRVVKIPTICNLCEFLHNQVNNKKVKVYEDMVAWWRKDGGCRYETKTKINQKDIKKNLAAISNV